MLNTLIIHQINRLVTLILNRRLALYGVSSHQYFILHTIYINEGPSGWDFNVSQLAYELGCDRTTLIRNFKLLEEKGFLTLGKNPEDSRMCIPMLCKKGIDKVNEIEPIVEKFDAELVDFASGFKKFLKKLSSTEYFDFTNMIEDFMDRLRSWGNEK